MKVSCARPLSALLSQILVAFTLELDNEFEVQIGKAGHPGARLSLVIWSNLIRFVPDEGISVRDLTKKTLAEEPQIKLMLGCLERWGFVTLEPGRAKPENKATIRSGDVAPALGRRDVGAAAKQRARDLVAQTEAFLRDPAGSLLHYPLCDMNRDFGP